GAVPREHAACVPRLPAGTADDPCISLGSDLPFAGRLRKKSRVLRLFRLALISQLDVDTRAAAEELSPSRGRQSRSPATQAAPRSLQHHRRARLSQNRGTVRATLRLRVGVEAVR